MFYERLVVVSCYIICIIPDSVGEGGGGRAPILSTLTSQAQIDLMGERSGGAARLTAPVTFPKMTRKRNVDIQFDFSNR